MDINEQMMKPHTESMTSEDKEAGFDKDGAKGDDESTRLVLEATNEDADFVENVMKPKIASINIKDKDQEGSVKRTDELSVSNRASTKAVKDNRKRAHPSKSRDSYESDSDSDSIHSRKTRRVRKRTKVTTSKGGSVSNLRNGVGVSENESVNTDNSDITVTLKAISLLEKRIDRGFDEIKERNAKSIDKIHSEIQSIRTEFNHRIDG